MLRRRVGGVLGGGLVAAILAGSPTPAAAADPSKAELAVARDLFARAERDEDAGRWADALDKLRRAGTVKMTPGIRFHIALCEEKLGQLVAALGDYAATEEAARAEGNKEVLDAVSEPVALLRARIPTLTIHVGDDARGATIELDGAALAPGLVGTPFPVDVGAHTVTARAPGRPPFSGTVASVEKQPATIEVHLPAPPSVVPAAPEAIAAPTSTPGPDRTAAIVTAVGAAGLVGFGVASYFVAGGKQSGAETSCATSLPSTCDDLKGGVRTWDALALGGWIAGAGLAAVSVYLWTRPASPSRAPARGELRVGPGTLSVAGRF